MLTVRTPSTTVTVLLTKADSENWVRNITAMSGQMSGLIVAQPGAIAPLNGQS